MRLFIAIPVPKPLHNYFRETQSHFEGLKKTEDFHLTLQFLGDEIESADPIINALNQVKFESFEIKLGDIKPFGPPSSPNGIWIACERNARLENLAHTIQKSMAEAGHVADKPFRAHITLGRYKLPPQKMPESMKGKPLVFPADHFELIQSHLTPVGPAYKTLKRFPAWSKTHLQK